MLTVLSLKVTGTATAERLVTGQSVTVTPFSSTGTQLQQLSQLPQDGRFTFDVPAAGDYFIRFERPGWLTHELVLTVTGTEEFTTVAGTLLPFGDLNGDRVIDKADLTAYAQLYLSVPSDNPAWDVDGGNGLIDLYDLAVPARHSGKTTPKLIAVP